MSRARRTIVIGAALVFATASAAAAATASWTAKDMQTAVRALHYPQANPKKLNCRGRGPYRCVATYRQHRRRVFYTDWQSSGGWVCAGATPSACKLLRHGFVTNAQVDQEGSVSSAAQLASRGYMANRYDAPQPFVGEGCPAKTVPTYSFCYAGDNNTTIAVNITMKKVRTGYTFTGGSTVQPRA